MPKEAGISRRDFLMSVGIAGGEAVTGTGQSYTERRQ